VEKKASAKGWFGVEGVAAREVFFLRQQIETVAAIYVCKKNNENTRNQHD
jgi:hypothetical protein